MNVLIAVASRHGSTEEIARTVAEELRAAGLAVDERRVEAVGGIAAYDAVVLGSAVYMGKWLPEAQRFVGEHREQLTTMPVWLFSSGPLGAEHPKPEGDPTTVPALVATTHARGHHVFVGRLDPHSLRFGERLIAKVVHAPIGDFRDWDDIRTWARTIAQELAASAVAVRAVSEQ